MCVCDQVRQVGADVYLRVCACVLHSSLPRALFFGAITCLLKHNIRASSCVCVSVCVSDVVRVSTCVCVCVCVSAGSHWWAKLTYVCMMFCCVCCCDLAFLRNVYLYILVEFFERDS